MKRHVLMILMVCVAAMPSLATDLTEKLCDDNIFVTMVNESNQVLKKLKSLNRGEQQQYLASPEFTCFRETITAQRSYLAKTYNLFNRVDSESIIRTAMSKILKQEDPAWCELMYAFYWNSCWSYTSPFDQANCFAAAQAWYNNCMGIGVE